MQSWSFVEKWSLWNFSAAPYSSIWWILSKFWLNFQDCSQKLIYFLNSDDSFCFVVDNCFGKFAHGPSRTSRSQANLLRNSRIEWSDVIQSSEFKSLAFENPSSFLHWIHFSLLDHQFNEVTKVNTNKNDFQFNFFIDVSAWIVSY